MENHKILKQNTSYLFKKKKLLRWVFGSEVVLN